jgi:hypothetical protein
MKKIIVSHKRANRVTTTKFVKDCAICIPESQKKEYEKYNDCEIITHPDTVIGLSPKRQWIYETYGDCFQIDDDVVGVNRVYAPSKYHKSKLEPNEISDYIDDLYELSKEIGCNLFGFNRSANPVGYNGAKPIDFNKYITGGAFGIIKTDELFFPDFPTFVGEDYWISALNAHYHRKSLIDQRIAFGFAETEANTGGVADYRTEAKRRETYLYLKQHFGNAIIPKRKSYIKMNPMKYEKTLKIPY